MFKFNSFTVRFKHITYDGPVQLRPNLFIRAKTICTIFVEGQETPVAAGVAMCSWKDNFDRSEGRKKAFARALWNLVPRSNLLDRMEWWSQFWSSDDGKDTREFFEAPHGPGGVFHG